MRFFKPLCAVIFGFSAAASTATAKLNIVTTTTTLAWTAKQIAGDLADVNPLLRGTEDVHFIDAVPGFVRKAADADILCANGLDLESGWLPKVLSKSGNAKIQNGGKGYCDLGAAVKVLEKPSGPVDRSMGDVHASGNPHYCLAPDTLLQAAEKLLGIIITNDPKNAAKYRENYAALNQSLLATAENGRKSFASAKKQQALKVFEYHKDFTYFFHFYGLETLGPIEEVPGVPPSAGRIGAVAERAKNEKAFIALGTLHSPEAVLQKFSEFSGVPHARVPVYVESQAKDAYDKMQERIISAILNRSK